MQLFCSIFFVERGFILGLLGDDGRNPGSFSLFMASFNAISRVDFQKGACAHVRTTDVHTFTFLIGKLRGFQ